jgi:hypothetical protein
MPATGIKQSKGLIIHFLTGTRQGDSLVIFWDLKRKIDNFYISSILKSFFNCLCPELSNAMILKLVWFTAQEGILRFSSRKDVLSNSFTIEIEHSLDINLTLC